MVIENIIIYIGLKKTYKKTVLILLQKQKPTDTQIFRLLYKHFRFLFKHNLIGFKPILLHVDRNIQSCQQLYKKGRLPSNDSF